MNRDYESEAREADEREYLASELTPIDVEAGPGPKSAIAIRLSGADIDRLKARADEEGIGFTQLARQWILERLDEPSTVPAEAEAALATLRQFASKVNGLEKALIEVTGRRQGGGGARRAAGTAKKR